MPERPKRVVRVLRVHLDTAGRQGCRAEVALQRLAGAPCIGVVEVAGPCSELEGLRSVAEAAVAALLQAIEQPGGALEVIGLAVTQTLGKQTLFVAIAAGTKSNRRELLGFALVEGDPKMAAARAVLSAMNRYLGVG